MFCRHCGNEIPDNSSFCQFCGGRITEAAGAQTRQVREIIVKGSEENSLLFPILTLLGYIFLYPAGLIANIVGLFIGQRKGCFLSLFLAFFVLPIVAAALIYLILGAAAVAAAAQ